MMTGVGHDEDGWSVLRQRKSAGSDVRRKAERRRRKEGDAGDPQRRDTGGRAVWERVEHGGDAEQTDVGRARLNGGRRTARKA